MRRIAFINEKGGTCKTTLCVNVAARLAARGRRVLVADLDTQGHAAKSLGVDPRRLAPTVHEWLLGAAPTLTLVVPTLYRKTQLADEILARLRSRLGPAVCGTVLGWSVKIDEAQSHGQTIFEWAPRSSGARALAAIADELLARGAAQRAA